MVLYLDDILDFSTCPKYFWFRKSNSYIKKNDTKVLSIVKKIIQKSYVKRTEYDKKVEWRVLVGWVDKEIYKDVDITNKNDLKMARDLSQVVLLFLQKWYEFDYIRNDGTSYINIPFSYQYGLDELIGVAPIVQVSKNITIIQVSDVEVNQTKLYNDINTMGLCWLAINTLDTDRVLFKHVYMGPNAALKKTELEISRGKCTKIKNILKQIMSSISNHIDYPSKTIQCESCEFKKQCVF